MHVFLLYFGLPAGAVWSNLIASLICFVLGILTAVIGRKRIRAWLRTWLKDTESMEERLKAHITSEVDKLRGSL